MPHSQNAGADDVPSKRSWDRQVGSRVQQMEMHSLCSCASTPFQKISQGTVQRSCAKCYDREVTVCQWCAVMMRSAWKRCSTC